MWVYSGLRSRTPRTGNSHFIIMEKKESKVFIERAAPLTKEGIRAVCGTDGEYSEFVQEKKQ